LLWLALAMRAEGLLARVSEVVLLDLIERAPADLCDSLREYLRNRDLGRPGARLLGLLDVVRLVRTDALDSAIERYWSIHRELDIEVNAALNRLLVYQLTDSGRIREAQTFLNLWRERHGSDVAGTPIEIQVAAREINILGTYGAQAEAAILAQRYLDRFTGRAGAWVLHMALANLAYDRGDGRERLAHAELALEVLQRERGPENMELDLLTFVAGGIVHLGDRTRWPSLPSLLNRADDLAGSQEILSITHRVGAIRAQQLMYRGDLREAELELQRIHRSAERSGELKRAQFIEGSLFFVARGLGEYQRLRGELPRFEALIDATEGIQAILSLREELIRLQVALGELAEAESATQTALAMAEEVSCGLLVGLFLGLRGRTRRLQEREELAVSDLRKATEVLVASHAFRHFNEYQLELIAADPGTDPDGTLIAAVIDHEEAVGERRLLPRAWQLEARRLRCAGGIREAALALEEAFRVAGTLVSPEHRWPLHVEAAELALAAGDRQAARADLERAVAILHDLSLQFTDPPVRERFLARPDRRAVLARLRSLGAE
jgi:tetratricopeptide (TPR) repeat protein